jgi:hypothetical protein
MTIKYATSVQDRYEEAFYKAKSNPSVYGKHTGNTRLFDSNGKMRKLFDNNTGAFVLSQLSLLDPEIRLPLQEVTYTKDLAPRVVTVDYEQATWTNTAGGRTGSSTAQGMPLRGINTNAQRNESVRTALSQNKLQIWEQAIFFDEIALSRSQKLGIPLDLTEMEMLRNDFQFDLDNAAALGIPSQGLFGLYNGDAASGNTNPWAVTNSANTLLTGGTLNGSAYEYYALNHPTSYAQSILNDLNAFDYSGYSSLSFSRAFTRFLVPPQIFPILNTPLVWNGYSNMMSIIEYFKLNCIAAKAFGENVEVVPRKYCNGQANGYGNGLSSNRIVGYIPGPQYTKFEYGALQAWPPFIKSGYQEITYYAALGGVEFLYPNSVGYLNGV